MALTWVGSAEDRDVGGEGAMHQKENVRAWRNGSRDSLRSYWSNFREGSSPFARTN